MKIEMDSIRPRKRRKPHIEECRAMAADQMNNKADKKTLQESNGERYQLRKRRKFSDNNCNGVILDNEKSQKKKFMDKKTQANIAESFLDVIENDLTSNEDVTSYSLCASEMKILVETPIGKKRKIQMFLQNLQKEKKFDDYYFEDLVTIKEKKKKSLKLEDECMPAVLTENGTSRSYQTLGVLLNDPNTEKMFVTTSNHGKTYSTYKVHFYEGKHIDGSSFPIGEEFYSECRLSEPPTNDFTEDFTALELTADAKQRFIQNSQETDETDVIIDQLYEEPQNELLDKEVQKVGASTRLTYGRVVDARFMDRDLKIKGAIKTELDSGIPYPSEVDDTTKKVRAAYAYGGKDDNGDAPDAACFTKKGDSGAVITTRPGRDKKVLAISTHARSYRDGGKKYSISIPLKRSIDEMNRTKEIDATVFPTRFSHPKEICFGIRGEYETHQVAKQNETASAE